VKDRESCNNGMDTCDLGDGGNSVEKGLLRVLEKVR